jgi:phosphoenolpyruvate synthase/pyruvate phosphate dikinase
MTTAARFVLWPAQIRTDTAAGGKARALAVLTRAGLPVPDWFVIPATAFQASLDSPAAGALAAAGTALAIARVRRCVNGRTCDSSARGCPDGRA